MNSSPIKKVRMIYMKKQDYLSNRLNQLNLSSIHAFQCVAKHLSFSRASFELSLTPTAVSNTIKSLENQLCIRLFNRSTRHVSLTEEGRSFLQFVVPDMEKLKSSIEEIVISSEKPEGTLKITMTNIAFSLLLEPYLKLFYQSYPNLKIDIILDNEMLDIVSQGYDAGIRLGQAVEAHMISKPLGRQVEIILVASKLFLSKNKIRSIEDLSNVSCIKQRTSKDGRMLKWRFYQGSEIGEIKKLNTPLIINDMRSVLQAAKDGLGVGYVIKEIAKVDLADGVLKNVLKDEFRYSEFYHIYYPSRDFMSAKLKCFIDFIERQNK